MRNFWLFLLTILILLCVQWVSVYAEKVPRNFFENVIGAFVMWLVILLNGWENETPR